MAELNDFYASGVSFPDTSRPDVDQLITKIPDSGTLHLAILQAPYPDLIIEGTKTVESRFNMRRAAPYGRVAMGDLVLLKQSGHPITGYFFASAVMSFALSDRPIDEVRSLYADGISAQNEEEFWRDKASSAYCTLIEIGERGSVPPLAVTKKDQRGWVAFLRAQGGETPATH